MAIEVRYGLAVFDITENGLVLRQRAPGVSIEELREKTEPTFVLEEYWKIGH